MSGRRTFIVPVDTTKAAKQAFDYAVSVSTQKDTLILYHGEEKDVQLYGADGGLVITKEDPQAIQTSRILEQRFMEECQQHDVCSSLRPNSHSSAKL
eukprot:TRINITY_DN3229_c0_g1_i4.p1 TRINITY_DN3229_c0_g1~~TRINITY_DN3229_c0_g1_i4.p1  ORF type:complete len:104 (+),score=13.12 TRINITY_DN3229_c0_g1_i4:24-314(+)